MQALFDELFWKGMIMVVPQNNPHPAFNDFKAPPSKSAMAITALVLGIIALITSFLPIINNLSFVLVVLGVIFSIVGLVGISRGKKSGKGIAIAALVICVLSGVIVLATQSMYSAALDGVTNPSVETVSSSDQQSASSASDSADFTIEGEALDKSEYSASITGTFLNNTDGDLSTVSLSYILYDADGSQIGNAYASATDVKAGASWKFEAYCSASPDEIASFERSDVMAW